MKLPKKYRGLSSEDQELARLALEIRSLSRRLINALDKRVTKHKEWQALLAHELELEQLATPHVPIKKE